MFEILMLVGCAMVVSALWTILGILIGYKLGKGV